MANKDRKLLFNDGENKSTGKYQIKQYYTNIIQSAME